MYIPWSLLISITNLLLSFSHVGYFPINELLFITEKPTSQCPNQGLKRCAKANYAYCLIGRFDWDDSKVFGKERYKDMLVNCF